MKTIELKIKSTEIQKGAELFKSLNSQIEENGLKVVSAEEEIETGMAGSAIILTIIISVGSSIVANLLDDKIKAILQKTRTKTRIDFEVENDN